MGSFARISLGAAAMVVAASAAQAADIIEPPVYPAPEVIPQVVSGWYLRGDIGMSAQQLHGGLDNVLYDAVDTTFTMLDPGHFSSAPTFQVGVGYKVSDWLRTDVTLQYRGKADFAALDTYVYDNGIDPVETGTDDFTAKKSEWLVMANAYVDLGTWQGVTPYVGAGIGASRNTISDFRDINVPQNSVAYGGDHSQWQLAWALHAGLGFQVTERLTLDLGYSYLNLGDAKSGDLITFDGTNNVNNPMEFNEITSHDFKFGLRYSFY